MIAAFLSVAVSNLTQLLLLIALLFMSNQAFYLQMFPFINAHMNKQLQTVGVTLYNAFFAMCFALYSILDIFVKDWRKMMLFFIASSVFLNIIYIIFVYNNYLSVSSNDQ